MMESKIEKKYFGRGRLYSDVQGLWLGICSAVW